MYVIANEKLSAISGGDQFVVYNDDLGKDASGQPWGSPGGPAAPPGGSIFERPPVCYANDPYYRPTSPQPPQSPAPGTDAIKTFDFATPVGAAINFVLEGAKSLLGVKK